MTFQSQANGWRQAEVNLWQSSAIYLFWNLRLFRGSDALQKIEIEPLELTYPGVAQALFSDIMDKEEL